MTTDIRTEPSIDAAFKAAAQSSYAALRALGPIHRARILNGIPCWMVVDYELAKQALTHPALVKDETPAYDTLAAAMQSASSPAILLTRGRSPSTRRRVNAAATSRRSRV